MIRDIKNQYGLKIVVVSNEARELNQYRITKFKLGDFVDLLHFVLLCSDLQARFGDVSHCPGHLPSSGRQVLFIDNTAMFVQIAEELGIRSICHVGYKSTRASLASFGLSVG